MIFLNGVLNIIKPAGMTSFDVAAYIGGRIRQKKIGHTGTLDPGACGLITLCLGTATKLVEYLVSMEKTYIAELKLGRTTETLDEYGKTIEEKPYKYNREILESILELFKGRSLQTPPMYSAIKINGKKLYELARRGVDVKREKREIIIHEIKIIDDSDPSKIMMKIVCSKGTYIRSLMADIGQKYGAGAHMGFLLRTQNGEFDIDSAYTLEEVVAAHNNDTLEKLLMGFDELLKNYDMISLDTKNSKAFLNGVFININNIDREVEMSNIYKVYNDNNTVLGLGEIIEKGGKVFLKSKKLL